MTEFYRLTVQHKNGEVQYPTFSDQKQAEAILKRHKSMPWVASATMEKITRHGRLASVEGC